jgi:hypothetical protein
MPYTADAIQRILCIAFLHNPNNIFQQQAFWFFLNMDLGRIAVELLEI